MDVVIESFQLDFIIITSIVHLLFMATVQVLIVFFFLWLIAKDLRLDLLAWSVIWCSLTRPSIISYNRVRGVLLTLNTCYTSTLFSTVQSP